MIATAFQTGDLNRILDAGQAAVDSKSDISRIVRDVRAWHQQQPDNWRAVRELVKAKYSRFNGAMRDRNGYELNTAAVIAALLFGQGDYISTSITAFNFGWDADNNAATACTIIGVLKGHRWMMSQGWPIKDQYRNTSRDHLPQDETITRFGDRLIALAERVIVAHGGQVITRNGQPYYRIKSESPANIAHLTNPAAERQELVKKLKPELAALLNGAAEQQARAAYAAICLDLAPALQAQNPQKWSAALSALNGFPKVVQVMFYEAGTPAGDELRARAQAAGLQKPAKREKIW
jgi:hypothetical protein